MVGQSFILNSCCLTFSLFSVRLSHNSYLSLIHQIFIFTEEYHEDIVSWFFNFFINLGDCVTVFIIKFNYKWFKVITSINTTTTNNNEELSFLECSWRFTNSCIKIQNTNSIYTDRPKSACKYTHDDILRAMHAWDRPEKNHLNKPSENLFLFSFLLIFFWKYV